MQGPALSGQYVPEPMPAVVLPIDRSVGPANSVWQRWRSLHDDILRHMRACDRLGIDVTIDQLAEELDEALGLVERRAEELQSLRVISVGKDRRVELGPGSRRLCG
ncbi:MAG: hypothetical protein AAF266_07825 [Planctomycetota bacterium]